MHHIAPLLRAPHLGCSHRGAIVHAVGVTKQNTRLECIRIFGLTEEWFCCYPRKPKFTRGSQGLPLLAPREQLKDSISEH